MFNNNLWDVQGYEAGAPGAFGGYRGFAGGALANLRVRRGRADGGVAGSVRTDASPGKRRREAPPKPCRE